MGSLKMSADVLCEEARFLLANVLAEGRYGRQNRVDDLARICQTSLSSPFPDYLGFLQGAGYLVHDRSQDTLDVTPVGERIARGEGLDELRDRAEAHLRSGRASSVVGAGSNADAQGSGARSVVGTRSETIARSEPSVRDVHRGDTGIGFPAHYERLEAVGTGGLGTVYRARQVRIERIVALKEVGEPARFPHIAEGELRTRFAKVAQESAQLSHPHVAPILDVGGDRGQPFIVSEFMTNGSVRTLLQDAERLPVPLVLKFLVQTLSALRYAHEQKIVHGGIKPENLLLDGWGNVRVSDFGFCRIVGRTMGREAQVYVGTGSVAYLAPELYRDPDADGGPGADLYATGIVFYEMLSGRLPGRRSPMPSKVADGLPAGLDDIFDRMTQDDPADRHLSVEAVIAELAKIDGAPADLCRSLDVYQARDPFPGVELKPVGEPTQYDQMPPVHREGSQAEEGGKSGKSKRRPYTYQQRLRERNKPDA